MYKLKLHDLFKELLGNDAEDEQQQYLKDIFQPSDMNATEDAKDF